MGRNTNAPWHKQSYTRFLNDRLPGLLRERLPLAGYHVGTEGPGLCDIALVLSAGQNELTVKFRNIPNPYEDGVFLVDGERRVVEPLASSECLDAAEVKCVGEQLLDFIDERLGKAPTDLEWSEALVRSVVPLDEWVRGFLTDPGRENVDVLDETNWLARCAHLRRIRLRRSARQLLGEIGPWTPGRRRMLPPGQFGRACPFETPEGPNVGRVLHVAVGATIEGSRCVVRDDHPRAMLGVTANVTPLLEHTDANRLLMGLNMMRQWLPLPDPEPALVRTGAEPDDPAFWCGRNLLTAFVSWGSDTYEDGLIVSESAAQRLAQSAPLEPGDKLSNRHGQKGVVSRVLRDEEMPHMADGTTVDIICSFIGLHTRLNYGQIREAVLGRIARKRGEPVMAPPFEAPTDAALRDMLIEAGLPATGMETLRDGRRGEPLRRPSTAGWVYWGKTFHVARQKLRVSVSPARGMRQGYREYLAMRDAGAWENINDRFHTCVADGLAEQIRSGSVRRAEAPTPSCTELFRRLDMTGIRSGLRDGAVTFRFAPPSGRALELARPVPHPWQPGVALSKVGILDGIPEYERLIEVNNRMARMRNGGVPAGVAEKTFMRLQDAVTSYLAGLVQPEHLRLQNRVAFSGRAVMTPATGLSVDEMGIPEEMAWELFGPFVERRLGRAEPMADRSGDAVEVLDHVMAESWVVFHRAPTLMPAAVLAFRPVRSPGRVIRFHPLLCMWVNGDFDGDQAAVFLPLTEAAQREAGAKLTVRAHLQRDPGLLRMILPYQDWLWGLAERSLTPEGRSEIAAIVGVEVAAPDGFVTRDTFRQSLEVLLEREGVDRTLDVLEHLMRRGFEIVRRSGASMHPMIGTALERPEREDDAMTEFVESLTGFEDPVFGPQALAVKSGARGNVQQQGMLLGGRLIFDARCEFVRLRNGLCDGRTVEETFAAVPGAREGLADTAVRFVLGDAADLARQHYGWNAGSVQGYGVLARAMRSTRPGIVFAHAAASGETDSLRNLDSRLFVGLSVG